MYNGMLFCLNKEGIVWFLHVNCQIHTRQHESTWMNPEDIVLREISQSQKEIQHDSTCTRYPKWSSSWNQWTGMAVTRIWGQSEVECSMSTELQLSIRTVFWRCTVQLCTYSQQYFVIDLVKKIDNVKCS